MITPFITTDWMRGSILACSLFLIMGEMCPLCVSFVRVTPHTAVAPQDAVADRALVGPTAPVVESEDASSMGKNVDLLKIWI